jgi:hypothetical protein
MTVTLAAHASDPLPNETVDGPLARPGVVGRLGDVVLQGVEGVPAGVDHAFLGCAVVLDAGDEVLLGPDAGGSGVVVALLARESPLVGVRDARPSAFPAA